MQHNGGAVAPFFLPYNVVGLQISLQTNKRGDENERKVFKLF